MTTATEEKFSIGSTYITPGAKATLSAEAVQDALNRHVRGDWGDCCPEDWNSNEEALADGFRLFSVYHDRDGTKFWVITEAE